MTVQRPTGRQARLLEAKAITRRAILDAALDLFITHGYAQVSIRNIAARVEYSPGAIYGYFASKDDIFFALAEEGLRSLGAREMADAPSADPVEDVRAATWRLYEFSKDQPQYFTLVFLDQRVPRVSREYERFAFISEMRSRALARVDRCVAEGLFPPTTHADVALRLLWAPIVGFAALRLSRRMADEVDLDPLVRDAIETTIAGIRAGAPRHARPAPSSAAALESAVPEPAVRTA
ncbi:MAG TPA: TetR/AcrR family transcriptional regulator [Pseudolysinimonas sp.]|nr:TetR/AcrR family transcriptional regulator [Pseudolysinimonas sp.]